MKAKTEIHVHPARVSVFDGGSRQVANILAEQCVDDMLPTLARALARGLAAVDRPIKLRVFDASGREVRATTIKTNSAKSAQNAAVAEEFGRAFKTDLAAVLDSKPKTPDL